MIKITLDNVVFKNALLKEVNLFTFLFTHPLFLVSFFYPSFFIHSLHYLCKAHVAYLHCQTLHNKCSQLTNKKTGKI